MSVGGWLIEIMDVVIGDDVPRVVTRLWCVDRDATEVAVYVERAAKMPNLGEQVWWQRGRVYFDGDKSHLRKIGYSFCPPGEAKEAIGFNPFDNDRWRSSNSTGSLSGMTGATPVCGGRRSFATIMGTSFRTEDE